MISYAQNFEDVMLARAFRDRNGPGFYIDVGAMDPVHHSVTKYFYDLGWHGINVEPNAGFYRRLCADRPRDISLNAGLGEREETRKFYCVDRYGLSTFSERVRDDLARRSVAYETIENRITTLSRVCRDHASGDIDFLKIDAEGWEGPIIRGGDWAAFRPIIVVVEAIEPGLRTPAWSEWDHLLTGARYIFVYCDGLNRFYVREENGRLKDRFAYPPNVFDGFTPYETVAAVHECERLRIDNLRLAGELAAIRRTRNCS
jgi:FkbM family methyltransferase